MLVMMAAVPAACLAAGYGAGKYLAPAPTRAAAIESAAEAPFEAAAGEAAVPTGERAAAGPHLVNLGRMTVPVQKPRSVTYVVADLGVSLPDSRSANHYRLGENAARLRDAILASLTRAAQGPILKGVAVDTEALSGMIRADLNASFPEIEDVLFLSFFKKDVPRG